MANQLPRLRAGGREPEAVDHIVETALEQLQQRFAGNPALAIRHFEVAPELVLQHAVNALDLLLFAELQAVAHELRLAQLSVLSRRQIALLDRALLRIAALPLQEELHSFAPAQPANRSDVTCHSFSHWGASPPRPPYALTRGDPCDPHSARAAHSLSLVRLLIAASRRYAPDAPLRAHSWGPL